MTYQGTGEQQGVTAGSTTYQYDGTGMSTQTAGSTSTTLTTLPDGTVISEAVSGNTYYYLSDGAGNVAGLDQNGSTSGTPVRTYSYDPTGNVTSSTGSAANPFTFQGGMYDSSNGYYFTGSGYYDPQSGQGFGCQDKGWVDPGEDNCGEDESVPQYCYNMLAHTGALTPQCKQIFVDPRRQVLKVNVHHLHGVSILHLATEIFNHVIAHTPESVLAISGLVTSAYAVVLAGAWICRRHEYFIVYENYVVFAGQEFFEKLSLECSDA